MVISAHQVTEYTIRNLLHSRREKRLRTTHLDNAQFKDVYPL
jgi:hypothetical protein